MSIFTDALKLAVAQEKLISKQEVEIANLKVKLEAAINGKAAADEATRIAREALKAVNQTAALELKEARRVSSAALKGAREAHAANLSVLNDETKALKKEVRELTAQLKTSQKPFKAPKYDVPTGDAIVQVKRKPGRPKKVVEETPAAPEVDPRQIPIPDLGEPAAPKAYIGGEAATPVYDANTSAKGNTYEFV